MAPTISEITLPTPAHDIDHAAGILEIDLHRVLLRTHEVQDDHADEDADGDADKGADLREEGKEQGNDTDGEGRDEDLRAEVLVAGMRLSVGRLRAVFALADLLQDCGDDHEDNEDAVYLIRHPGADDEEDAENAPEEGRADPLLVRLVLCIADSCIDADEADDQVDDLEELAGKRHIGALEEFDDTHQSSSFTPAAASASSCFASSFVSFLSQIA
jgi:hypothetical protein